MVVSCDLGSLYRLPYRYRECQKLKYTLMVKHPGIYACTCTLDIMLVGNTCTIIYQNCAMIQQQQRYRDSLKGVESVLGACRQMTAVNVKCASKL